MAHDQSRSQAQGFDRLGFIRRNERVRFRHRRAQHTAAKHLRRLRLPQPLARLRPRERRRWWQVLADGDLWKMDWYVPGVIAQK